jgi:hypothetical protein
MRQCTSCEQNTVDETHIVIRATRHGLDLQIANELYEPETRNAIATLCCFTCAVRWFNEWLARQVGLDLASMPLPTVNPATANFIVEIAADGEVWMLILANLLFACSHPLNRGEGTKRTLHFVEELLRALMHKDVISPPQALKLFTDFQQFDAESVAAHARRV